METSGRLLGNTTLNLPKPMIFFTTRRSATRAEAMLFVKPVGRLAVGWLVGPQGYSAIFFDLHIVNA